MEMKRRGTGLKRRKKGRALPSQRRRRKVQRDVFTPAILEVEKIDGKLPTGKRKKVLLAKMRVSTWEDESAELKVFEGWNADKLSYSFCEMHAIHPKKIDELAAAIEAKLHELLLTNAVDEGFACQVVNSGAENDENHNIQNGNNSKDNTEKSCRHLQALPTVPTHEITLSTKDPAILQASASLESTPSTIMPATADDSAEDLVVSTPVAVASPVPIPPHSSSANSSDNNNNKAISLELPDVPSTSVSAAHSSTSSSFLASSSSGQSSVEPSVPILLTQIQTGNLLDSPEGDDTDNHNTLPNAINLRYNEEVIHADVPSQKSHESRGIKEEDDDEKFGELSATQEFVVHISPLDETIDSVSSYAIPEVPALGQSTSPVHPSTPTSTLKPSDRDATNISTPVVQYEAVLLDLIEENDNLTSSGPSMTTDEPPSSSPLRRRSLSNDDSPLNLSPTTAERKAAKDNQNHASSTRTTSISNRTRSSLRKRSKSLFSSPVKSTQAPAPSSASNLSSTGPQDMDGSLHVSISGEASTSTSTSTKPKRSHARSRSSIPISASSSSLLSSASPRERNIHKHRSSKTRRASPQRRSRLRSSSSSTTPLTSASSKISSKASPKVSSSTKKSTIASSMTSRLTRKNSKAKITTKSSAINTKIGITIKTGNFVAAGRARASSAFTVPSTHSNSDMSPDLFNRRSTEGITSNGKPVDSISRTETSLSSLSASLSSSSRIPVLSDLPTSHSDATNVRRHARVGSYFESRFGNVGGRYFKQRLSKTETDFTSLFEEWNMQQQQLKSKGDSKNTDATPFSQTRGLASLVSSVHQGLTSQHSAASEHYSVGSHSKQTATLFASSSDDDEESVPIVESGRVADYSLNTGRDSTAVSLQDENFDEILVDGLNVAEIGADDGFWEQMKREQDAANERQA